MSLKTVLYPGLSLLLVLLGGATARAQLLADSRTEFSGVQGQNDWFYGYRNYTVDGGGNTYDPVAAFIAFAGGDGQGDWDGSTQFWSGSVWDLNTAAAAPWTVLGQESIHPNGDNNGEEHWVIRRWVANELTAPTALAVTWNTRKQNIGGGNGVTGGIWVNGKPLVSVTIAFNSSAGVTRTNFLAAVKGDRIDLVLSPMGINGAHGDGNDGTLQWMRVEQAADADADGLPDPWELLYAADLTKLSPNGDADSDGLKDGTELSRQTNPTLADSDVDGLADSVETNTGKFVSASDTGTDPSRADTDGDQRKDGDEINGTPKTDPFNPDTDGDNFSDGLEVANGHNPNDVNDTLESSLIANSITEFSGEQGKEGWTYGYRNATADGGAQNYDPVANFIAFPGGDGQGDWDRTTQLWTGSQWDMNTQPAAPWTELGPQNVHPNTSPVHWVIRRWEAKELTKVTPLALRYHVRKGNLACGTGVTAGVHINGQRADAVTLPFNDGTGVLRTVFANVAPTDRIDVFLNPRGTDGSNADGCDGSNYYLHVDPVLPAVAYQPDGSIFIPVGAGDSDADGIPDVWEYTYFPGDLTKLTRTGDFEKDGLLDPDENLRGSDPTKADTDGDGLTDKVETKTGNLVSAVDTGTDPAKADSDADRLTDAAEINGTPPTNPNKADTDGDKFQDGDELAEGTDPNDPADNPLTGLIAHSISEFSGVQGKDGWYNGHRNFTADGGEAYDATSDFLPYAGGEGQGDWNGDTQLWTGSVWDLNTEAAGPWTYQGPESIHPNGINSPPNEEHWAIRRWVADELTGPTPVTITWQVRKENQSGGGVGAILMVNGTQLDAQVIAAGDTANPKRKVVTTLKKGDRVDLAHTPENADGTRGDGSDGSATWFMVSTRVPAAPAPTLTATRIVGNKLRITSDPQPLPAGFVLEVAPAVTGVWTPQPGLNTPTEIDVGTEPARFLRAIKR